LKDLYLLVIGLVIGPGVCRGVLALVGVDGFCNSKVFDILNGERKKSNSARSKKV
jgi:hypothetical protein